MSITMRMAIDKVLDRLSLASGADTQTYAEASIKYMIQHKFDVLFDDYWWPQFKFEGEYTLDGVSGVITDDISADIKAFKDIRFVFYGTDNDPLPRAPELTNPKNIKQRCIGPIGIEEKVFKIYPTNTTGDIYLVGRTHPGEFIRDDDIIDMDEHLIVLGAAYDYLNGIGTNPAEEEKLLGMFSARLNQWEKLLNSGEVSKSSYTTSIVGDWQEIN